MDDIPQGGSGGVPEHPDPDIDIDDQQQGSDNSEQRVKTVRAGVPVAEQKADREGADSEQTEANGTDE